MSVIATPTVLDLLRGRSKDLDRTRHSYQLEGDRFAMDTVLAGEPEVNESEMSFVLPFADGVRRDGVGDLLEVGGINCDRHRKNPISLFDHGKQVTLPLGLCEDPKTGTYTVDIDPIAKIAKAKVFVYQGKGGSTATDKDYEHAVLCEQVFDMWAKKFIRSGSIGYQVVSARELGPDYETGTPKGLHLLSTLLLEASAVVLPANADTVRKCLEQNSCCGKPLSPYLVKSFSAFATEPKVMMGYTPYKGKSLTSDLTKLAKEAFKKKTEGEDGSPDYGQLFLNNGTGECWYVTADGDSREFTRWLFPELEKVVGTGKVKMEAESFPKDKENWQQIYPKKAMEVPVPLAILPTDQIPPPDWKPGVGATKELDPNDPVAKAYQEGYISGKHNTTSENPYGDAQRKTAWESGNTDGRNGVSDYVVTKSVKELRKQYKKKSAPQPTEKKRLEVRLESDGWWVRGYAPYSGQVGLAEEGSENNPDHSEIDSGPFDSEHEAYQAEDAYMRRRQKTLSSRQKSLDMTDIRKKYRPTKGLRRRLRKSAPGTSLVHVNGKDLDAAREFAEGKGVKFTHVGDNGGFARVKLIGDDEGIDSVAQEFGKKIKGLPIHTKSDDDIFDPFEIYQTIGDLISMGVTHVRDLYYHLSGAAQRDIDNALNKLEREGKVKVEGGKVKSPKSSGGTCKQGERADETGCTPSKYLKAFLKNMVVAPVSKDDYPTSKWAVTQDFSVRNGYVEEDEVDWAVFPSRLAAQEELSIVQGEKLATKSFNTKDLHPNPNIDRILRQFLYGLPVPRAVTMLVEVGLTEEQAQGEIESLRREIHDMRRMKTSRKDHPGASAASAQDFAENAHKKPPTREKAWMYDDNFKVGQEVFSAPDHIHGTVIEIGKDKRSWKVWLDNGKQVTRTAGELEYKSLPNSGIKTGLEIGVIAAAIGGYLGYRAAPYIDGLLDYLDNMGFHREETHAAISDLEKQGKLVVHPDGKIEQKSLRSRRKDVNDPTPTQEMFEEGYQDAKDGYSSATNPYRIGSEASKKWREGWDAAKSEKFRKSLNRTQTKSLKGEVKNMEPEEDEVTETKDMSDPNKFPYSAQMNTRVLEDHKALMKDYDEMHQHNEHPEYKKAMQKLLESHADVLDTWEGLAQKHHPEIAEHIIGEKDLDDEEAGEVEGELDAVEGELDDVVDDIQEDESEEEKDLGSGDTGADTDDTPKEEPTADEALEGMNKAKRLAVKRYKAFKEAQRQKHLRTRRKGFEEMDKQDEEADINEPGEKRVRRYGKKAVCPECGKEGCSCGTKALDAEEQIESADDSFEVNAPQQKGLEPHEIDKVTEAAEHAKALSEKEALTDEDRMKAYHYHKALADVSDSGQEEAPPDEMGMKDFPPMDNMDERAEVNEPGEKRYGRKDGEMIDTAMDMAVGKDLHPHRKCCKDASEVFGNIATTKDFGDPHREQLRQTAKALSDVASTPPPPPEEVGFEPGQMDQKAGWHKSEDEEEVKEKRLLRRKIKTAEDDLPPEEKEELEKSLIAQKKQLASLRTAMKALSARI